MLRFSAAIHVAAGATAIAAPATWPVVLGVLATNHLVLFGAGLTPRSSLLGPNLTRLPRSCAARNEVALTFDDGPDPVVTPKVLDLLDARGSRATFFVVGDRAAAHPALMRDIVRRGHGVGNHTQRHSTRFGWYGWRRLTREIAQAQDTIASITSEAPRFFRAPFGARNPLLDPVLAHAGLQLVSWTRRGYDTIDGNPARVLVRLTHRLEAGAILLLHDGIATGSRRTPPCSLSVLPRLLDAIGAQGLRTVTLDQACGPD